MKPFKPMLAAEVTLEQIIFPIWATPKLDGIRAVITPDGVMSRNWKLIPNRRVQETYGKKQFIGFDGELIMGDPTASDVYRRTMSACSTADHDECPSFYVFDRWDMPDRPYVERQSHIYDRPCGVYVVGGVRCANKKQLLAYENACLEEGYEGLILRGPDGLYKCGRSTRKEHGMLKFKRFVDSEAIIVGMQEEMENRNEKELNAFGKTKRSGHKANKVGKGRMGALHVRDLKTKVEFDIGTGFTAEERVWFWKRRKKLEGMLVKYKHFPIGIKDKPRFPSYLGIRAEYDK